MAYPVMTIIAVLASEELKVFSRANDPRLAVILSKFNLNQKLAPFNSKDDEFHDKRLIKVELFCFKNSISRVKLQNFILQLMINSSSISVPPFQQPHPSCVTTLPCPIDDHLTDGNWDE
uniref:Uncharacterized protein n=1 Tax=Glossina palpalis gambiensis TaxID=67801 RepID=A0A1B0BNF6_9MUSC